MDQSKNSAGSNPPTSPLPDQPDYYQVAFGLERAAASIRARGSHGLEAVGQSATPPWVSALIASLGPVLIAILQSLIAQQNNPPAPPAS